MAMHMKNDHIRYYHMDATWSVGLAWSYFSYSAFLVIQCWMHTTFLFPDSETQTWEMDEGIICNCIMVILGYSDAMQPFVVTAFPFFYELPNTVNNFHLANGVSGSNNTPMQWLHVLFCLMMPILFWWYCLSVYFTLCYYVHFMHVCLMSVPYSGILHLSYFYLFPLLAC